MIKKETLCSIVGLPAPTMQDWIKNGVVAPNHRGGKGRGNASRFNLMRSIGLLVAAAIHRSERSCVPAYVTRVVNAFDAVTEEWLLNEIAQGRDHFVTVVGGKPVLRGKEYDWVNVSMIYDEAKGALSDPSGE